MGRSTLRVGALPWGPGLRFAASVLAGVARLAVLPCWACPPGGPGLTHGHRGPSAEPHPVRTHTCICMCAFSSKLMGSRDSHAQVKTNASSKPISYLTAFVEGLNPSPPWGLPRPLNPARRRPELWDHIPEQPHLHRPIPGQCTLYLLNQVISRKPWLTCGFP